MGSCCSGQERVEPGHEREVWQDNAIILSNSHIHHIWQVDVPLFQVATEADYLHNKLHISFTEFTVLCHYITQESFL